MALIIYPLENYTSFCSETDATLILTDLVPDLTKWNDIDVTTREVYLRQATLLINQRVEVLPETLEIELQQACAYLANHSIDLDMTNSDDSNLLKEKDIDGVIKKVWFNARESTNSMPDIVESLLSKYDQVSSGSFSIRRL